MALSKPTQYSIPCTAVKAGWGQVWTIFSSSEPLNVCIYFSWYQSVLTDYAENKYVVYTHRRKFNSHHFLNEITIF
jgi:hypothetical protein